MGNDELMANLAKLNRQMNRMEHRLEQSGEAIKDQLALLLQRTNHVRNALHALTGEQYTETRDIGAWVLSRASWEELLPSLLEVEFKFLSPELRALIAGEWILSHEDRQAILKSMQSEQKHAKIDR